MNFLSALNEKVLMPLCIVMLIFLGWAKLSTWVRESYPQAFIERNFAAPSPSTEAKAEVDSKSGHIE